MLIYLTSAFVIFYNINNINLNFMNRRNFLKTGSILISAAAISKLYGFGSNKLLSNETRIQDFSIELITDDSDKAALLIENLIKDTGIGKGIIKYSEYDLAGIQNGDIVFFNSGKLVNYKDNDDIISRKLREISSQLGLPKIISNAQKIKFYTQTENHKADKFLVIHNNTIIKEIQPSVSEKSYLINGSVGNLSIIVNNNKLRVTESSCKHKTCVNSKSISRAGEYIVCIPNEIVIMAD